MSTTENILDKSYDPTLVEPAWVDRWEAAGYFGAASEGKPYTIVIPPPNVTGSLHMGHALNSTLQDILIRYHKMKGFAALWVPGTDHGGIATQNVVEKLMKKEGVSRHQLGREKFLERMWAWRQETGDNILFQLRKLGAALDWTRTRFTMDEVCSKAVRKAFVDLYKKKLLYRGKRLVNWCPRCGTALADIEVEHKDSKGSLWHIKYPSQDGASYVTVATTRPETLLGDTAVAVHPDDERYRDVAGKMLALPLTNRFIPVIADDAIDAAFGSGAVKVTPAHDPTDFEIGHRHHLPHVTVIGFDGKMTAEAGPAYVGLDRFAARKKVVADLEAQGLLEKVEDHNLALSVCYRCDDVVEPLESEQWFLSMRAMADRALEAGRTGQVRIVPESWENPARLWLENIRDWCVSRQIWWGHRIPVWTCEAGRGCERIVSEIDPTSCPSCGGTSLVQDPDVLDTWFSSALWPFSVFNWPDNNPDLKRFFPTATLVTGHEILYLWVVRMVMFALEFHNTVPFKTVLIHGIVRDKQGRKMSKSIGNVIDPLDLIKDYGADALRFSLAQSAVPGRDMHIAPENFVSARNFSNKIWNATRFALMNMPPVRVELPSSAALSMEDKWILHRTNDIIETVTQALESFDMSAAARALYHFFWSDFCDWYLETAKPRLQSAEQKAAPQAVLAHVLETSFRLLHPFTPFITEELWQKLPRATTTTTTHLMASSWPVANPAHQFPEAYRDMVRFQEVVTKLRSIRSEMGVPPPQPIEVHVQTQDSSLQSLLETLSPVLASLNTKISSLRFAAQLSRPPASVSAVVPGANLFVPLSGLIDFSKEKTRLEKELGQVRQDIERMEKKLANADFTSRAPAEEVAKARERLAEAQERSRRLGENIEILQQTP
jgi:valyl-tRNA synthetase